MCFFFLVCIIFLYTTCCTDLAFTDATFDLSPLRDLFETTLRDINSTVHFIVDVSKNITLPNFHFEDGLKEAYRTTSFQILQITFTSPTKVYQKQKLLPRNFKVNTVFRKFTWFVTHIYFNLDGAYDILEKSKLKSAPNIAILFCDKTIKHNSNLTLRFRSFHKLPLTSIFIAVHYQNDHSYKSLLCFTCQLGFEKLAESTTYANLVHKWNRLNGNLREARIAIKFGNTVVQHDKVHLLNCNIHKYVDLIFSLEGLCLHITAQKILNYTINPEKKLSEILFEEHGNVDTKMVSDSAHVKQAMSEDFEIIARGIMVEPYVFFSVVNQHDGRIFAMLRPFDRATWGVLGLSIGTFSLVLFCMPLVRKRLNFILLGSELLGTFLDQSTDVIYKIFNVVRRKPILLMVAWTMWSAMVLLIGNEYKGEMVSLLTMKSTPPEPTNLEELLNSNISITTKEYSQIGGKLVCALRDLDIKDILKEIKKPIPESNIFKRLTNSLKWVTAGVIELERAIAFKGSMEFVEENESVDFSYPYAIIETKNEADYRHKLATAFSDNWVSKIYPAHDMLGTRCVTAIKRNFFMRQFTKIFARIEEAGLYDRWRTFGWNMIKYILVRSAKVRITREIREKLRTNQASSQEGMNLPQNIYGFIFAGNGEQLSENDEEDMAMDMAVHLATFRLLLGLLVFSLLVFIAEIIYIKMIFWIKENGNLFK